MSTVRRPVLVTAGLAGTLALAGSFAVGGRTPAFVAAPVGSLLAQFAPGSAMTTAIANLGDYAQVLAFAVALVLTLGLFAGVAWAALVVGKRSAVPFTPAVVGFVGAWLAALALTGRPVGALTAAGPLAAALVAAEWRWRVGRERPTRAGRRSVLKSAASVAGLAGAATLLGWNITGAETGPLREIADEDVEREARDLVAAAEDRSLDVDGLEPTVSTDFYEVDINSVNPNPTPDRWSLSVTGAVETELELSYEELLGYELEHRFATLRCVGDSRNGEKMDTALWTGVPVSKLLDEATPDSGCGCVMLRATDGYYNEFPIEALQRGFLAVGMDGDVLPRGHGYPVRALVPGHWGEVNVKWLDEIEVLQKELEGYWEKKGWYGTGPVNAVAKVHAVNRGDGRIEVAGHAYAGTRGVARVEVSTDGGDTWADAELSEPLPGTAVPDGNRPVGDGRVAPDAEGVTDVWRQWRHAFEPTRDEHVVVARVVDGFGNRQPREREGAFPRGASGWVRKPVRR